MDGLMTWHAIAVPQGEELCSRQGSSKHKGTALAHFCCCCFSRDHVCTLSVLLLLTKNQHYVHVGCCSFSQISQIALKHGKTRACHDRSSEVLGKA